MKRMKSKKFNSALIAATLSASIILGGTGAALLNNKRPAFNALADSLESNYQIQTPTVEGKTYYVAPNGTADGEGTESSPRRVQDVLQYGVLKPGDTVMVMPGTYKINEPIKLTYYDNGTYNNYITVKNASETEKAVLDFSGMSFLSTNRGVQIDGDYWYWYGVDICGAGDNGMYIGGSYNVIENCEFYNNRDTGLQLGRSMGDYSKIEYWPSYNLIKNCTSYNNYDNETYGENADGFAAKLTVGYGNIFDGCIAYRNSDDGWDLFAKTDSGNIGAVILYNCVAFENGFIAETQAEFNERFPEYNHDMDEPNTSSYLTRDGDGNGFKLGGSVMEGDVFLYNCLSFNNRMHGVTDNSNPGVLSIKNLTAYNNSVGIDDNSDSPNFGQVVLNGSGVTADNKCGNINLARHNYSYNLMSRIVSVNDGIKTVDSDEYRGAVEYSYFDMVNGRANKIEECIDASHRAESYAQKGTSVAAISADIFAKVPSTWGDTENPNYAYNLSGKGNYSVHADFRNSDGSINMGDMLRIKDYSTLFGDENKIGADLTKEHWEDYTHYSYFNASNADSAADAAVKSAIATLDLNTFTHATFQDFDLVVKMEDVNITWESSDSSVIKINTDTPVSVSGTQDARAIVYRGTEDKTVTLTATVTHAVDTSCTAQRVFEVTVKKDVPTIGDAIFEGVEDGRIIIDQFARVKEPAMSVRNAADYNGKLLDAQSYSVETAVTYGADKATYPAQIHKFTTSVAGVYGMTKKVTLNGVSKEFNYSIYVASPTANVNFVRTPAVTVNRHGYTIGGEVSSATGKLYAYSSATPVEDITAEQIISEGLGYEFRNDNILFQFENDNSSAYYIYYVLCNLNGDVTSTVSTVEVTTQNISNAAQFKAMLLDNNSETIYLLTDDIDLSKETDWVGDITSKRVAFKGVLNGLGHTVSGLNVAVTSTSDNELGAMFYRVEGGTIENIKFHDITIKGNEKTGLIATTYGGYLYNIELRNIHVDGTVRVGGLVGQAMNGALYVEQVSLVNDAVYVQATATEANFAQDIYYVKVGDNYVKATEYESGVTYYTRKIEITGQRSAGIIGFIQASKATDNTQTYISNCYVNAVIGKPTEQYVGSIVGSADDRNAKDYLEISKSYSAATLYSKTYMGGIIGSHNKVEGKLRIYDSVYSGTLYYSNQKTEPSQQAVKNCSGIVGRFMLGADAIVSNCYAVFADYNADFDVDSENYSVYRSGFWSSRVKYDTTDCWEVIDDPDDPGYLKRPYIQLNFLGNWD